MITLNAISDKQRFCLYFFIYVVASLSLFSNILIIPFYYDDIYIIQNNFWMKSLEGLKAFTKLYVEPSYILNGCFRPLLMIKFWLQYNLFFEQVFLMRLFGLLLHSFNAFLFYLFLFNRLNIKQSTAFLSGLMFLIHPLTNSFLGMIWKQSDLWIAFYTLSTVYLFTNTNLKTIKYVFAFALFLLALFTKESSITIPCYWALCEPMMVKQKRMIRVSFIFIGLLLSFLFYKYVFVLSPPSIVPEDMPMTPINYFYSQMESFQYYLRNLIYPNYLTIDHSINIVYKPNVYHFLFLVLSIFTSLFSLYQAMIKKSVIFLLICFCIVSLIPTSSIVPLALQYDETRIYILNLVFCFLIVSLFSHFRKYLTYLLMVYFALFAFKDTLRWQDEFSLWESALKVDNQSIRSYGQLGHLYMKNKMYDEAILHYEEAVKLNPYYEMSNLQLGVLYGRKGLLKKSDFYFKQLFHSKVQHWKNMGYYHLGLNQMYMGNQDQALLNFRALDGQLIHHKAMAIFYDWNKQNIKSIEAWRRFQNDPRSSVDDQKLAQKYINKMKENRSDHFQ